MGLKKLLGKSETIVRSYKYVSTLLNVIRHDNGEKRKLLIKVLPYTQLSYLRLNNIYELCTIVEKENIIGDFVECGVWKGGSTAIMAFIGRDRKTWLFDSFEGMPEATSKDVGELAEGLSKSQKSGALRPVGTNVARLEVCKHLMFDILKLSPNNLEFVKGWFQETLPGRRKIKIAVLRIDGDFYESTKCCLDNLYDSVVSSGYVIVDDYYEFPGCKLAVDEFIAKRHLKIELVKIDDAGVYFKKI